MTLPDLAPLAAAEGVAFFDPFALHARLDFDFNDRDAYTVNFPILIHEYTHYLQSVSTVYGLYRVLDWIRTGVRLASVLPALTEIRIPLLRWGASRRCPPALRAQVADIQIRMDLNKDLEQPSPLNVSNLDAIGPLRIAQVPFSDGKPGMVAAVTIGDGLIIPIGARALAEGMSASVQRVWEIEPRLDAVLAATDPKVAGWYTATRSVLAALVQPDQDLDYVNAFVCDMAMLTSNPAAAFVAAVIAIIDSGAASKAAVVAAVREALQEMIAEEVAATRKDVAGILERLGDSDEPFAAAVRRLLTSSDEMLQRRSGQPGFVVDVLFGRELREVQSLLQRYPLPCYFQGTTFLSWHGDEALARLGEELLMMEHAIRILLWGPGDGAACPLTESSTCPAPKSDLCGSAPWKIDADGEGMVCAFAGAMHTFGALGKVLDGTEPPQRSGRPG